MNDFFGLSEINKIQEEIEKDLNGTVENEIENETVQEKITQEETTPLTHAEFYRETIKPAPQKKPWVAAAAVLLFACTVGTGMLGFGIGSGWAFFQNRGTEEYVETQDAVSDSSLEITSHVFENVTSEVATLSDMVELLAPSVVSITTHRNETGSPFDTTTYGTGIIFADTHDRIFIATSLYVVRHGERWDVSINGSDAISARPVDSNYDYGLAVAYIYKEDLLAAGISSVTHATFGNSDEMRVGDVVIAIGNALGDGTSVTRGIISAAERQVFLPDRVAPLMVLQTDAAINYGDSGGPLINTRGEIIGINLNQASRHLIGSSQAEGMGYSISSNIAAPVLEEIIANYRTPAIGIVGVALADDAQNMAEYWNIPPLGVLVIAVQEGRPAQLAGILPDDVITSFGGQPIFDMLELQSAVRAREIGETVEIRILRGGSFPFTLEVEIAIMYRESF